MTVHKPVLLKETIELLNLKKGDVVVDATLGGGGHSREILNRIGDEGILIAIDLDINAINRFAELPITNYQFPNKFQIPIFKFKNQILVNDNFSNLRNILDAVGIEKVDAILADLGWSSDQVVDPKLGMSFMVDAPLDMRYDQSQELTAKKIINEYPVRELERIIKNYGEERWARRIAKEISEIRETLEINKTKELAEIISNAIPRKFWPKGINPATRTFQALRIEVNEELDSLKKFVPVAIESLEKDGRLAIITFHSLEDRIVKNIFKDNAGGCVCPPDLPQCVCGKSPVVKIITRKPIIPGEEEIKSNSRARSAKLRVAEKM